MKTTGKMLLSGLAAVLIGITVFFFVAKTKASDVVEVRQVTEQDRTKIEKTYDFRDFQNISVIGGWQLSLTQADTYSISITMPQYLEEMVTIEKKGDTLVLAVRPETQFNMGPNPVTAELTLPQLHGFQTRGGSQAEISDFTSDTLRIDRKSTRLNSSHYS